MVFLFVGSSALTDGFFPTRSRDPAVASGRLVRALRHGSLRTPPVTLDAGTNKGLLAGMELVVTQPQNTVKSVRLTRVAADQSEGVMVQAGEEEPDPGYLMSFA